ncbi:MAG: dihydrolipoyllysine-residue succinyltransferase [Chromatiales bacterium]|nr:dihydrolipoyllysine-residue succinyltransferase [Chromatiales bacterium]
MSTEVRVPTLPESVADATLAEWHKAVGDRVERGENLADLETDKVVLELPAPVSGTVHELRVEVGATVQANAVIALIEETGEAIEAAPGAAADSSEKPAKPAATASMPPAETTPAATTGAQSAANASPSVRRQMREQGVDPSSVQGSGKHGRILAGDLSGARATGERPSERVPMTRLRARIAERLLDAKQSTAMLTTFNEVDMLALMELRKRHRDAFEKRHGVKLGFMSMFVRAASEALRAFPAVNASIDGPDIVYHGFYDIGVAVSTERGLVVPVLRDADRMSLADIERGIGDFATRARDGSLSYEDLAGGTFTITNGGVFGSMLSTPILNPPQSAILGMHATRERPVVVDGQIVVRPIMYLALSYDHRLIDGAEAVRFLVHIKDSIEDPARLLLDL